MSASTAERLSLLADGQNARCVSPEEVREANKQLAADGLPRLPRGRSHRPPIVARAGAAKIQGWHVTDNGHPDYALDLDGLPVYIVGGHPYDSHGWQLCHRCGKLAGSPFCFEVCGKFGYNAELNAAFNRRIAARGGEW